MLIIRSLLVLTLALVVLPAVSPTLLGVARVIDGDTLEVAGQRVRLFGIDAPERDQTCDRNGEVWACGQWAGAMLAGALTGPVSCAVQDHDRYGRAVAICHAGGRDLGRALVEAGAARAYLRYSDRYAAVEADAGAARLGIWAGPMVTPEAHRHRAEAAPAGCAIKGNISDKGRIFHRPGQRDYAATRISPEKGEAWFCTASDAEAAGFRPARR
ncbi:thermonuclease family protein [Paracoccaceae bacterium Fryx2]|nr:thermonuclease family protein [Paracoccaceae bacterium Fryx2]